MCNFLKKQGINVHEVSSSLPSGINPVTGIFNQNFSLPLGTYAVVYLSQSPYYKQVPQMAHHLMSVNVVSAIKAAELAIEIGAQKFFYASSGNVYAPSFFPLKEDSPLRRDNWYSLSKIFAEEALLLLKELIDMKILRFFGVYGPKQKNKIIPNIIEKILNDQEILIYKNPHDPKDLNGLKISLCYIDDIVKIIFNLLFCDSKSEIINVAGNRPISIKEIALTVGKYLEKKPKFKILNEYRETDFIADISLLKQIINPTFTDFDLGIKKVIQNI